uniref:SDR family NAD(P)-dependent oxidoreductase n=1 Tax=uncultured Sphingomonas sp. TaxID=158754 RepID=UPI0035CCA0CB
MPGNLTEMRFDDDVVIVTGAGRGLGREHALAFALRGAAVVVNDVDTSVARAVVQEIAASGGRAVADGHSVADATGAAAIVAAAIEAYGKVTVLVNNAGVIDFAALVDIEDAAWRRMIAITLDGTFQMSKTVWPHFARQGYGRIINTTSNAGFAGNETLVHYGAAKMGVAGLTRALAQEVGGTGITVNAIAPMAVTRMNLDAFFGGAATQGDDWQADIRDGKVPMGPPSIVSPTVLWLAHRSTTINGEIFSTSSGKVARVAFVLSDGFFDPDHGPEELRDHSDQIRTIGQIFEPRCTADELMVIPRLFGR